MLQRVTLQIITDYYRLLQNVFSLKVPLILYLLQITDYIHNI